MPPAVEVHNPNHWTARISPVLIFESFHLILLQRFLLLLSPFGIPIMHILYLLKLSYSFWMFGSGFLFLFFCFSFSFLLLHFNLEKGLLTYPSSLISFLSCVESTNDHLEGSLHFSYRVLISIIFF